MNDDALTASLASLRAEFPIVERVTYMNHAATGPISKSVQAAMARQTDLHARHIEDTARWLEPVYGRAREAIARLVGARAERVAFIQNTSHGISMLANGQAWQEGDNVVVPALEFPSNYLAWLRLQPLGVELRTLEMDRGMTTADRLSGLIDSRTRIVALSAVQYFNGFRCDLAEIADVVHAHDARLVVDGTQSVGAMRLDMAACGVDALVVSAHKWMLGPLGIGFMALSDRLFEETAVTQHGWLSVRDPYSFRREIDPLPDARRFEPGTENSAGIFGLMRRLEEIDAYGLPAIERRILGLTARLAVGLQARGFTIDSPGDAGARSGILSFRREGLDGESLSETLKGEATFIGFRHGALRASPHYYNSEDEVDALVERIDHGL